MGKEESRRVKETCYFADCWGGVKRERCGPGGDVKGVSGECELGLEDDLAFVVRRRSLGCSGGTTWVGAWVLGH